ncbi:MAG: sulfotransferase [Acidobacteria bacterium]|nr:sulfotransferase [Acidobacteriota bacterium]
MSGGPLVVGALGGSGTRLVAALLMEVGYHLGDDLNPEKDNLWFTLLFKRPRWYAKVIEERPDEIRTGLRVLERAMVGGGELGRDGRAFLLRALREALSGRHGQTRAHTPGWPLKQAWALWRGSAGDPSRRARWGWKEPNSHVYLRELSGHFPGLKFVYVVRHGLDMAYSGNRQQLRNWGPLYGVPADGGAAAMLEYWIRATRRAVADGERLLGERFLLLNYDELCTRPVENLPRLLRFAGVDPAGADLARLARLAEPPLTMGRYREHDLHEFPDPALDAVEQLGFPIDGRRAGRTP